MSSIDSKTPSEVATIHDLAMAELDDRGGAKPAGAVTSQPRANGSGDVQSALRQIRVELTVRVGSAELSVGELVDAKAGQVLRLDRSLEEPVDVLLDGRVVARGTLVAADDRFAVRITELPVALDLSGGASP